MKTPKTHPPQNCTVKYCAKLRTSPTERSEAGATLLAGDTIISEVCRGGGSGKGGRKGAAEQKPLPPRVLFLAPDADVPEGVPPALLTLRAPAEVLARLAGLATTAKGSTSLTAVAVVDLPREATFLVPPPPTTMPPPPSTEGGGGGGGGGGGTAAHASSVLPAAPFPLASSSSAMALCRSAAAARSGSSSA